MVKFRTRIKGNIERMFTLSVEKEIAAAHQLRDYDGPCANVHGHCWKIRAEVAAEELDQAGIAIDFAEIENLLWRILGPFDHRNFNDIAPFDELNPTAENIARYIYRSLAELLPVNIRLKNIQLWETDRYRVTYEE